MPRRTFAEHREWLGNYPHPNTRHEKDAWAEYHHYASTVKERALATVADMRDSAEETARDVNARLDAAMAAARTGTQDARSGERTVENLLQLRAELLRERDSLEGLAQSVSSARAVADRIEADPLADFDARVPRFPALAGALPDWAI